VTTATHPEAGKTLPSDSPRSSKTAFPVLWCFIFASRLSQAQIQKACELHEKPPPHIHGPMQHNCQEKKKKILIKLYAMHCDEVLVFTPLGSRKWEAR
jgi:hypothetical protein